jgi:uncharacterized protein (UPF0548 family)
MRFAFFQPSEPDDTRFLEHPDWRERPLTYTQGDENRSGGWKYDEWEREIKVPRADAATIFEQARARLINFDIIPPTIMHITTQWNHEGRLPQQGDVIFQRTHLIRIGNLHLVDVLSATRLGEVVDDADCFSLVYIATKGHPEKGFSRYSLRPSGEHSVTFKIETTSQPANFLTKLANPIITRRTQLKITYSVLDTMERGVIMDLSGI